MKTNYTLVILALAILTAIPIGNVLASNNNDDEFTDEEEKIWGKNQDQRPAINPDFAPNFDCIYNVFQKHCVPGSEQECPKPQFSAGDPEICFPKTLINGKWKWECPKDYHSIQDDETGQCYPDEEGCPGGTVWRGKTAESHTACVDEDYCLDHPDTRDCDPEDVCDHWGYLTKEDMYCGGTEPN